MKAALRIIIVLVTIILVILPLQTASGGIIKGKITNKADGEPLWGAQVSILSEDSSLFNKGVTTDRAGLFGIADIPAGSYSMTVSMVGFEPFDTTGIEVSVEMQVTIDLKLTH
ncbi:MAG: carboxypeptidase regulatory-like domain-containing protein, partial [Candidatus Zixiibacteriota bacterium]